MTQNCRSGLSAALFLLLLSLVTPRSEASPRYAAGRRSYSDRALLPAGGGIGEDTVAQKGEECRSGGSTKPILCAQGLTCRAAAVAVLGLRVGNPDAAVAGVCVPDNTVPSPVVARTVRSLEGTGLAEEGQRCQSGGNIMPILCDVGLECSMPPPPAPGTPGLNPDSATVGVCVNANTVSATLAKEGENCTTGGNGTSVSCMEGLYCDMSAATVASSAAAGPLANPDGSTVGVCQQAAEFGALCYAGGDSAAPGSSWSAPCAGDLVCYVLDPSPPTNNSLQVQTKLVSNDVSARFLGFCVNSSEIPALNSRQGSGTQAGECKLGVPLTGGPGPCQLGLTCVAPMATVKADSAGATTFGVCADASRLIPVTSSGVSSSHAAGTPTENGSPPSPNSALPQLSRRGLLALITMAAAAMVCGFGAADGSL